MMERKSRFTVRIFHSISGSFLSALPTPHPQGTGQVGWSHRPDSLSRLSVKGPDLEDGVCDGLQGSEALSQGSGGQK